jgi:hypothetical protein
MKVGVGLRHLELRCEPATIDRRQLELPGVLPHEFGGAAECCPACRIGVRTDLNLHVRAPIDSGAKLPVASHTLAEMRD